MAGSNARAIAVLTKPGTQTYLSTSVFRCFHDVNGDHFTSFRDTWRAFLEGPETFRVDFGQDKSHCIL